MTTAHHALTAQASDPAIDTACRLLRLPTMRARAADTIARAEREGLSYAGFLAELLMAECEDRDRRRAERRIRAAHFPREKSLREFDHTARSYSYAIEQAPFPVTGYLSTLSVHPVPGRAAAARVEWSGSFTPVGVSDADAEELFHGIYTDGLAALLKTTQGWRG
ncbi:SRPBCC family protein [Streptomyces sp. NPDC101234]|uniref:SRPBCC family protein n=1 Tax=Streptomyces sp. NPDC101234 TaxID=3366138 RepID=UPI0037F38F3A